MSKSNSDSDWHNTQNDGYIDLCRQRLDQPLLNWVRQFVSIINSKIDEEVLSGGILSINDYGCNVGHFCRAIGEINSGVNYIGYDISKKYLNIAGAKFGSNYFHLLDFSKQSAIDEIRSADISVMSATLEHVFDFKQAIFNIFSKTRRIVIIRTFIGSESLMEMCRTVGASEDYLIRQFTFDEIVSIPVSMGWNVMRLKDMATGGDFKFVCNSSGICRRQEVLVFVNAKDFQ